MTLAELKKRIEVMERVDILLHNIEEEALTDYKVVSEVMTDEQDTNWKGELLWEDTEKTIPKMRVERTWDRVLKEAAELTDDDHMTIEAIKAIRKALYKMVNI